ncbi:phosphotransferase, partial [Steroidobacter sp.]|uniref:phosphotransferase n=1 Tax=Steroidobacter sp. TaxID=1978227 RepID=UPI001A377A42
SPTLERTFAWLRANVGRIDQTRVLVHGDYDLRNVLIGESGITAVLDWERSHVGHPAEDLAYCMQDVMRVMSRDEFLQRYRRAGGPEVATEAIEYFQLWAAMARLTGSAEVKDTYLRGRHRDFVLGTAGVFQYPRFLRQVAELLAALDPCN